MRGFDLKHCPVNNLYEATTFIAWTHRGRLSGYSVRGRGCVSRRVCLAGAVRHRRVRADAEPRSAARAEPEFSGAVRSLHAALILLAYGAFGLAAVAGVMFLTQEHDLKFHKLRAILSLLPPIQRLELITNGWCWPGLFC